MNAVTPDPTSTEAAEPTSVKPGLPGAVGARMALPWVALLALLLAGASLAVLALLWQRVGFVQLEVARRLQDTTTQMTEVRAVAAQAEAMTQELQARLSVAEIKLSEVSLQRTQLEELMLALSRSQDDNLVQDIESALRLAMQQAQLSGSALPLVSALQAADQRISRAAQPRLNPVQRALQRDIERIKAAALTDVPTLVLRVDDLVRMVDGWPLLNDAPVKLEVPEVRQKATTGGPQPQTMTATEEPAAATADAGDPAASGSTAQSAWVRMTEGVKGFWRQTWASVSQHGRELIRISRIDQPEAVLLAPEQSFFLRENLKLRLLNVRLGLLGRQLEAVDADLKTTEAAVARYFDASAPAVQAALQELTLLRSELPLLVLPRPDESLAALAAAAGGR